MLLEAVLWLFDLFFCLLMMPWWVDDDDDGWFIWADNAIVDFTDGYCIGTVWFAWHAEIKIQCLSISVLVNLRVWLDVFAGKTRFMAFAVNVLFSSLFS